MKTHPPTILSVLAFAAVTPPAGAAVDFVRDVRPILADTCFNCHGVDAKTRKAKLRLDNAEGARDVIVPGRPEESELVARIFASDPDEQMPPPEHGVQLTVEQRETLKQWIAEGGEYVGHWAFAPIEARDVPAVSAGAWARSTSPIDAFVHQRMEERGLAPSGPAPKRTLIRRLSLDLTGLPPTPTEVQSFLSDGAPDAFGRLVDRLLESPRFGERMAMWWLDGARYADSHGFQADWERYQWPWRDWVIKAFNDNMPFDQFTVEQLAGDMLPDASTDQIVATGFNRNHRINTEGGSIAAEWLVENVIDRVETAGSVWLGLTLGCARCHDHKYDPISQKEFYQLFAYFHNVPEAGAGGGKGNHKPTVTVMSPAQEADLADLVRHIAAARANAERLEKEHARKTSEEETWMVVDKVAFQSRGGALFKAQADGSFLATGENPATDRYQITLKPPGGHYTAVMIEALPDPSLRGGSVGRASNGNFVLTEIRAARSGGEAAPIDAAHASYQQKGWPVAKAIDGDKGTGWAVDGPTRPQRSAAVFRFAEPVVIAAGEALALTLDFDAFDRHAIGRPRVSLTTATSPVPPGERPVSPAVRAARDAVAKLEKRKAELGKSAPTVMVMREMEEPRDTFVLNRGQYDQPAEKVEPGIPAAFPPLPDGAPNNRLGFAKWVVSPDNPLTARVQVNRFWEMLFGQGLVGSSENFGTQAEPPSHPQLLDWLAAEFVRSGWDTKAMLKTIVTSKTYQQSSAAMPTLRRADPQNVWLARGPRFRVQAEAVRDSLLFVSGLLQEKLGGPAVYPYQPPGIWSEFNFYGNLRNYKHATDANLYRRSLYTIWKRTAAPPGMTLFDMPSREICTVKRSRTNTPLQALALMNDVTYIEASRAFAERMIAEGGSTPRQQLGFGFELATGRPPAGVELQTLERGFQRRWQQFETKPDEAKRLIAIGESKADPNHDPAYLAALTTAASVILNLDETITKE